MSVLAPLAAFFLLLVPVLVVFYLLKVRRQDHEVASTFLWRHLTRDVTAHEPWQRLRWNPLLLLQMLVMLGIIAALVRPYLRLPGSPASFDVIVLDGSASMAATDVKPSRFDVARSAARNLVAHLATDEQAAIIEVGDTPRTLAAATTDHNVLNAALDAARPTVSVTNMRPALELALALAHSHQGGRIDVISDGAFTDVTDLGDTGVPIHFLGVGGRGENEAITSLSARPQAQAAERYSIFVRVANYSDKPAHNQLTLAADNRAVDSKDVTAAPGASQDFIFDNVPAGAKIVEASLRDGDDLAFDNQAYLVLNQLPPPRVLLVTTGNRFLLTALRFLPVRLFQVAPNDLGSVNTDNYDLVVLDSLVPPILPKGNLLLVNPPNSSLLPTSGTVGPIQVTTEQRDDPAMQYVDLANLQVRTASKVTAPGWARVLASDSTNPVLLTGQVGTRKVAVLPFALQQSNLPLLPDFPILMANLIEYLEPAQPNAIVNAASGGLLSIQALPQADQVQIERPDRSVVTLPRDKDGAIAYQNTDEAGLYVVTHRASGHVLLQQTYAVNVLDEQESDIKAVPAPAFAQSSSSASAPLPNTPAIAPYEVWPYLAALAALLLMVEWWWYHRRA